MKNGVKIITKNTSCSVQQMIWNKDVQKTEERKQRQDKKENGKR